VVWKKPPKEVCCLRDGRLTLSGLVRIMTWKRQLPTNSLGSDYRLKSGFASSQGSIQTSFLPSSVTQVTLLDQELSDSVCQVCRYEPQKRRGSNVSRSRVSDTSKPGSERCRDQRKSAFCGIGRATACSWLQRPNDCAAEWERSAETTHLQYRTRPRQHSV